MPVKKKHLIIKKSQIPAAGKGLFTKKDIRKGSRIVEYTGKIKRWDEVNEDVGTNRYLLYVSKNHVIDAEKQKDCYAIYANDAKGPVKNAQLKNNSSFLIYGKRVFITANRKIAAGEEIFV
ncbi:MAG: SET domain-containing protein, partial [Fimbriimonadaceae bacterium]|nr:SET domain-containing protein [Chitinophagales bacterium]